MKSGTPVVVASRSFSKHPALRAELEKRYARITYNEESKRFQGRELIEFLRGHEKAIIGLDLPKELAKSLRRCLPFSLPERAHSLAKSSRLPSPPQPRRQDQ